ncbi:hypothetical protein BGAL_0859g00010 [Botrytis galanthina]|uniref:Uncharacterized protein n=1 Tax=Botrytis galanthina TaxID=278940 RepID=A0A4S8QKG2_9HELO|nr:hypothetical protein BGAL_0859g00010 [Botrytis galanthina]
MLCCASVVHRLKHPEVDHPGTLTELTSRWVSLETSILRRFITIREHVNEFGDLMSPCQYKSPFFTLGNSRSASSRILTLISRLGIVEVIQYYSEWHRRDPQGGSHKDEHVHGSNLGSTAEKPLEEWIGLDNTNRIF